MPIVRDDFSALTGYLDQIFNEAKKVKIAESVGLTVFNISSSERETEIYRILHGVKVIEAVDEGQDLPVASTQQGDTATWTQQYYGGAVAITKRMRKFELYGEMRSLVRSAVDDAFDDVDQSLADTLLFGWDTSYQNVYGVTETSTCPDSLAVFSASHSNPVTSTTFSNIITLASSSTVNPPVSRTAIIDAQVAASIYTDPEGKMRPINIDSVLVAPAKYDIVDRIVNSPGVQGTPNVDSNPLRGTVTVKKWPRLSKDSALTDKSNYWFAYDSSKVGNSLQAIFAEKITMDPPEEVYINKNWEYTVDFFYTIGRGFPPFIMGSKGTSAT